MEDVNSEKPHETSDLVYRVFFKSNLGNEEPILSAKFIEGTGYNLVAFPEPTGKEERVMIYDRKLGCIVKRLEGIGGRLQSFVTLKSPHIIGAHYDDKTFRVWNLRTASCTLEVKDLYPHQQHHPKPTNTTVILCRYIGQVDTEIEFQVIDWRNGKVLRKYYTEDHFLFWCFNYEKLIPSSESSGEMIIQHRLVTYGRRGLYVWEMKPNSIELKILRKISLPKFNYFGIGIQILGKTYAAIPTNKYGYVELIDFEGNENDTILEKDTVSEIEVNDQGSGVYFIKNFPGNLIATIGEDRTLKLFKLVDPKTLKFQCCRIHNISNDFFYNFHVCESDGSYELLGATCDPSEVIICRSPFLPTRMRLEEEENYVRDRKEIVEYTIREMESCEDENIVSTIILNHKLKNELRIKIWKFLVFKNFKNCDPEKTIIVRSRQEDFSLEPKIIQTILLGQELDDNNNTVTKETIVQLFILFEELGLLEFCVVLCLQLQNFVSTEEVFPFLCECLKMFHNIEIEDLTEETDLSPLTQQLLNIFVRNRDVNNNEIEKKWCDQIPKEMSCVEINDQEFLQKYFGRIGENIEDLRTFQDCFDLNLKRIYEHHQQQRKESHHQYHHLFNLKLVSKERRIEVVKEIMIFKSRFMYSMKKFNGQERKEMEDKNQITIHLLQPKELEYYVEYTYTNKIAFLEQHHHHEGHEKFSIIFKLLRHADLFFEFELYYYLMRKLQIIFFRWLDHEDFVMMMKEFKVHKWIQENLPYRRQLEFVDFFQLYFDKDVIVGEFEFEESLVRKFDVDCKKKKIVKKVSE